MVYLLQMIYVTLGTQYMYAYLTNNKITNIQVISITVSQIQLRVLHKHSRSFISDITFIQYEKIIQKIIQTFPTKRSYLPDGMSSKYCF